MIFMKMMKLLYKLALKKYVVKEGFSVTLILVTTLLTMLKPLVTSGIIDQAIGKKNFEALKFYILLFIIIFFVSELLRLIQLSFNIYIAQNMTNDMQYCFFRSFTRRNVLAVSQTNGDLINRITNEVPKITEFITNSLPVFIMNIFTLIIGIVMMFILNKQITLCCLCFLPLIFFINKHYSPKVKEQSEKNIKEIAKSTDMVQQTIKNIYLIKYFRRFEYIDSLFMICLKRVKESRFSIFKLNLKLTLCLTITTFFPHLIVLILSAVKVMRGDMSLGEMVALTNYIGYIISPVLFFSQTTIGWQQTKVIINRFLDYSDIDAKNELKKVKGNCIELKGVDFQYPGKEIFKDLNFQAKRGDKVMIQGKNGTGKTTFINLITNLITVNKGSILIDGEEIGNVDLGSLISISMQSNSLFNDTIRNNINIGRSIPDNVILQYAHKLGFDEMMNGKLGLDYIVSTQGSNLSGGQAQKINILRAVVGKTPIIVFDEFDSFLDVESKKTVEEYINSIQNAIVFVISHHEDSEIQYTKKLYINSEND